MFTCEKCGGSVEVTRTTKAFEIEGYQLPCLVEDIIADQCRSCGDIVIGAVGQAYIDRMIDTFKNKGVATAITDLLAKKKLNFPMLAKMYGEPKQSMHRRFMNDGVLAVQKLSVLCEIANLLEVSLAELVQYYPVVERDGYMVLQKDAGILG